MTNGKHKNGQSPIATALKDAVGRILARALGLTLLMYILVGVFGGGVHPDFFTIKGFLFLYAIGLVTMVVIEILSLFDSDDGKT